MTDTLRRRSVESDATLTDTRVMQDTTANAYLKNQVMTASPAELRLMLLDGALKFANQARDGLERKDFEGAYNGFTQCRAIIMELINGIRPEHDPELADRVRSLYLYMYKELFEASFDKDIPRLVKIIELLGYERETWMLLMEQIAREAGDAKPPEAQPPAPDAAPKPLSIQA